MEAHLASWSSINENVFTEYTTLMTPCLSVGRVILLLGSCPSHWKTPVPTLEIQWRIPQLEHTVYIREYSHTDFTHCSWSVDKKYCVISRNTSAVFHYALSGNPITKFHLKLSLHSAKSVGNTQFHSGAGLQSPSSTRTYAYFDLLKLGPIIFPAQCRPLHPTNHSRQRPHFLTKVFLQADKVMYASLNSVLYLVSNLVTIAPRYFTLKESDNICSFSHGMWSSNILVLMINNVSYVLVWFMTIPHLLNQWHVFPNALFLISKGNSLDTNIIQSTA